jgi:N-acetyl-anhydromuramyl-L-alanine amidase AmpD
MMKENFNHIILSHTYREANGYLASLSFRFNSKYDKKPHYFIDKMGNIEKLLDVNQKTNIFKSSGVHKNFISIVLENLGYLKEDGDTFLNWKGEEPKLEPFMRTWRGFSYWDPYTDIQMEKLVGLCSELCEQNDIPKIFIGHNTKTKDIEYFRGIITRSNFSASHTDLNPSFDFGYFKNELR